MSAANKAHLDMQQFIEMESSKSMLKFITCGSVDDGKSTLIGRLLYDSQLLYDDQLEELKRDSKGRLSTEEDIDFSLLVDGLAAEREQGITIDVAYRFFSTSKRKFIVADTPGHEQYTRNMATGASTAEAAVLLIDARLGVSGVTQCLAQWLSHTSLKQLCTFGSGCGNFDSDYAPLVLPDYALVVPPMHLRLQLCLHMTAATMHFGMRSSVPMRPYPL